MLLIREAVQKKQISYIASQDTQTTPLPKYVWGPN